MRRSRLIFGCVGVALLLAGCRGHQGSDLLMPSDIEAISSDLNPPGAPQWQVQPDPANSNVALVSRLGQDSVTFQCSTGPYFDSNVDKNGVAQRTDIQASGRTLTCWTPKPLPSPSGIQPRAAR